MPEEEGLGLRGLKRTPQIASNLVGCTERLEWAIILIEQSGTQVYPENSAIFVFYY